jgi:hypothetical protein
MGSIPPGLFQLNTDLQGLFDKISGVNDSLTGADELKAQVSGYLLKLRQGAGLVVLQDLFDHLRAAKKQLGFKLCKMIQSGYAKQKVFRILNEFPAERFYTQDLTHYDLVPQEGILTATQQQAFYAELRLAKSEGAPISWKTIFENAPVQMKEKLLEAVEREEQSQRQAQAELMKEKRLLDQMRTAKINADNARADERQAQVAENRAGALLDRIRAVKEMSGMDDERILKIFDRLLELDKLNHAATTRQQAVTKR